MGAEVGDTFGLAVVRAPERDHQLGGLEELGVVLLGQEDNLLAGPEAGGGQGLLRATAGAVASEILPGLCMDEAVIRRQIMRGSPIDGG